MGRGWSSFITDQRAGKTALRVPFLSGSPKKEPSGSPGSCWERTWVFWGSLSLRNWPKSRRWPLGEGTAAASRKHSHPTCLERGQRPKIQMCSKLPRHSADTHEGPTKCPMGDSEAAKATSLSHGDRELRGETDTQSSSPGEPVAGTV